MIVVCDRDGYLKTYLYFSWGLYYPLFFGDYGDDDRHKTCAVSPSRGIADVM